MVNRPVRHDTRRTPASTALRLFRWLAATFIILDAVASLAAPPPPGTSLTVHVVLTLWSAAGGVLALYHPVLGALVSVVPVCSTMFVGVLGQDLLPLMTSVIMVCAMGSPRAALLTVAGAFAYAVATGMGDTSGSRLPMYLLLVAGLAVVGGVVRLLMVVNRRVQGRIDALHAQTAALRVAERVALADELSDLLTDGLAEQQAALSDARDETDPAALQARLAAVERHARESLSQLRGLVSTLRGRGSAASTSAPAASEQPPLSARAEELEDILVGHGHATELILADSEARVGDFARQSLGDVLLGAAPVVVAGAPAGAECRVEVSVGEDTASVGVSYLAGSADGDAAVPPELRRVADALAAAGGMFTTEVVAGRWSLVATVPLRATATSTPSSPDAPLVGRRWEVVLPAVLRGVVGAVAIVMAILTAGQVGVAWAADAAVWPNLALWCLVWVALAVACWRAWLGAALLVAALGGAALVSPPTSLWFEPPHVAIIALAALVVVRRPGWWWALLLGWGVYVCVWFRGFPGLNEFGAMLVNPLVGLGTGFAAHYFLQVGNVQATRLDEAAVERRRAREEVRRELAGELHDIVAHQLSLITMQVEAHRGHTDPVRLRAGLDRIAAINESAQADLVLLLHVMRADAGALGGRTADVGWLTPTGATHAAATTLRDAGHVVVVDVDDAADGADATTRKTVTRIVREATTNILRYAPERARCALRLHCDEQDVHVEITNTMPVVPRRSEHSTGFGLIGLDERVRITGGDLAIGAVDGSWRVAARLPLATTVDLRPRAEDEAVSTRRGSDGQLG